MFSLIAAWINGWVNNREAGNLRRHRADHDVIVDHDVIDVVPILQCVMAYNSLALIANSAIEVEFTLFEHYAVKH